MEFGWPPEIQEFRESVRAYIQEPRLLQIAGRMRQLGSEEISFAPEMLEVRQDLDRKGWLKKSWPVEQGGQGESPWFGYVLAHELRHAGIPFSRGAANMVAPAIMRFGTDEQKREYVPRIWSGEISVALGYSEPNAGTDLASLQTRAVADGDDFVINGQKVWTSAAHHATHVWLATRTDPDAPKHRGISVFIVPLDSPGITINPIWTSAGVRTNEVFYQDVRVPRSALIGEENRGWYIIANALDHERVTVGVDDYIDLIRLWDELIRHLSTHCPEKLAEPANARRFAELLMELRVQRGLLLSNASLVALGETPTMEASMVKVWGTELRHRLADAAVNILGRAGLLSKAAGDAAPIAGEAERTYRWAPVVRFAGGTNEVQRNIIAQRGLGLPR